MANLGVGVQRPKSLTPQEEYERALMQGELDSFEFILAESLGQSLQEIRDMPNTDYLQWRAYYVYRAAQKDLGKH